MALVVGVSFREACRIHYFDPGAMEVRPGDVVVAETARGIELGVVRVGRREVPEAQIVPPLRPVLRLATEADRAQEQANRQREREALRVCAEKVARHGLPMKLLGAEYTLDRARVVIFFAADGRVDFRELVKDLAAALRTRIELHQVGARDAAKLLGGFGRCGRPLCCTGFLCTFQPVSMKMAKDQDLALNPTKFSGQCGKLMCCLRFEVDEYREARRTLPRVGAKVQTAAGVAKVVEVNVPAQAVRLEYPDTGVRISLSTEAARALVPAEPVSPDTESENGGGEEELTPEEF
ncbi:MAG: stage 0 sporulation family protein [Armatimonadota bacterium]|nr:stage 0 sporulation family protein [Armatimonadota bacterium]